MFPGEQHVPEEEKVSLLYGDVDVACFLQHCGGNNVIYPLEWSAYIEYIDGGDLELSRESVKMLNYHLGMFVIQPDFCRNPVIENQHVEASTLQETTAKTIKRKAEEIVAPPGSELSIDSFAEVVGETAQAIPAAQAVATSDESQVPLMDGGKPRQFDVDEQKLVDKVTKTVVPLSQPLVCRCPVTGRNDGYKQKKKTS